MSRTLALVVVAAFVVAALWSAPVAAKPTPKKKKVAKHLKAAKIAKKVPNRSRKLVRVGPRKSLRHHPKLVNVTQMKSARRARFLARLAAMSNAKQAAAKLRKMTKARRALIEHQRAVRKAGFSVLVGL